MAASRTGLLVALAVSWWATPPARACVTCGCGDPTLTATGVEKPYKNRVRIGLEERFGSFSQGEPGAGEHTWFLRSSLAGSWAPHERVTLGGGDIRQEGGRVEGHRQGSSGAWSTVDDECPGASCARQQRGNAREHALAIRL